MSSFCSNSARGQQGLQRCEDSAFAASSLYKQLEAIKSTDQGAIVTHLRDTNAFLLELLVTAEAGTAYGQMFDQNPGIRSKE